jgi:RHS repeat-associated protein
MKQAQQVAAPNTVTSSTYFGPLRIKKVVGTTTTRYVYSGSFPIAEYLNGSTTPSKEYIYAGSDLLATTTSAGTTYHHADLLSNRAESDSTGATVRTFGYFPYGESWYEIGTPDPMKFTTYSRDSGTGETGLDYAIFRHYNSGQGRFMSADYMAGSIGLPQSLNRYAYVGGDPTNTIDPLGLTWIEFTNRYCVNADNSGDACEIDSMLVWVDDGPPLTFRNGPGSPADKWGIDPRKRNLFNCLAAANKEFVSANYDDGPRPPSPAKVFGVDNADSVGTTATATLLGKLLARSASIGLSVKEMGNTAWYTLTGAIASMKNWSRANDRYNAATAACHAKFGN